MVRFLFVHFVSYFIESKIQRKCNESFFVAFALHCLFMIRKTCHYTRTGCGEIPLASSPRASSYVRPLAVFLRPATGHLRPAFIFSSPVCDSVGDAQIFLVCQLQDSSLDGQWLRAARYALRVARSVVVSLSLSRRSRI